MYAHADVESASGGGSSSLSGASPHGPSRTAALPLPPLSGLVDKADMLPMKLKPAGTAQAPFASRVWRVPVWLVGLLASMLVLLLFVGVFSATGARIERDVFSASAGDTLAKLASANAETLALREKHMTLEAEAKLVQEGRNALEAKHSAALLEAKELEKKLNAVGAQLQDQLGAHADLKVTHAALAEQHATLIKSHAVLSTLKESDFKSELHRWFQSIASETSGGEVQPAPAGTLPPNRAAPLSALLSRGTTSTAEQNNANGAVSEQQVPPTIVESRARAAQIEIVAPQPMPLAI